MNPRLKTLVTALSIMMLVAYAGTFAAYAVGYLWPGLTFLPAASAGEGVDYVWTSASVLVGSVVAVALGQPDPNRRLLRFTSEDIVVWYGWGWAAVGASAILVWVFAPAGREVPLLIKNAATTFLGLVIPVVAGFLRPSGAING